MRVGTALQTGSPYSSRKDRRFEKRRASRCRRKAFRMYGENAPTEQKAFIRGWDW
jgi:hypothetical protein